MLPDTTRFPVPGPTTVLAALTGLAAALLAWLMVPGPHLPAADPGWTQAEGGPVGPADRALLDALRQDALWQVPVGEQAQQMAVDPAVRRLGGALAVDVAWLGGQVRAVADRLRVVLPSQPTAEQQAWQADIGHRSGPDYDAAVLDRLRQACARGLDAVTEVGATTHNDLVRLLTRQAADVLGRHLADLRTGADRLPAPAVATAGQGGGLTAATLALLLIPVAVLGLSGRPVPPRARRPGPPPPVRLTRAVRRRW